MALVESALGTGEEPLGIEVELTDDLPPLPLLFGEDQGRVVVSCAPEDADEVQRMADYYAFPCREIGRVTGPGGRFRITCGSSGVDLALGDLNDAWSEAIPRLMGRVPETSPADAPLA